MSTKRPLVAFGRRYKNLQCRGSRRKMRKTLILIQIRLDMSEGRELTQWQMNFLRGSGLWRRYLPKEMCFGAKTKGVEK